MMGMQQQAYMNGGHMVSTPKASGMNGAAGFYGSFQPATISTRILINQTETNPDGTKVDKEQLMDVILNDKSEQSIFAFNKATNLISQGLNQEGIQILMELFNQQKVEIIQVSSTSSD